MQVHLEQTYMENHSSSNIVVLPLYIHTTSYRRTTSPSQRLSTQTALWSMPATQCSLSVSQFVQYFVMHIVAAWSGLLPHQFFHYDVLVLKYLLRIVFLI